MKLKLVLGTLALLTVGVTVALAGTAATYPPPSTETAKGVFIVNCPFSHRKQVDPIISPGPTGTRSAHMHDFLGNRSIDSSSTYVSATAAGTTCTFTGDTAGYWVPTLVGPNGAYVTPRRALVYYRNNPVKYGTTTAFPPDFRVVAGGVGVGPPYAGWSCDQDASNMVSTPPTCASGPMVLHVKFPNCWNGATTDSATHRSHVTYPTGSSCPSTHPVKVPEIFLHVRYPPGISGSGYRLSDGTQAPHADFWNTWQQAKLVKLVNDCLRAGTNCGQVSG
jgi:Domain of unknown function (DUF1996)